MSAFPKPYADFVAKLRVSFGFVLVIAFGWMSQPSPQSMALGFPFSMLGLVLRGWATGHLEKNLQLAESGPYAYVRNPLYLGTLLVAAGLVIAARRWILAALFAAVFLLVYLPVIELEEQHLRKLFPAFASYSQRVPALWPTLHPLRIGRRFRWDLYVHNREYQALLGFIAGMAFLAAKMALASGRAYS
jgi:protein-S-isoprenylcysteine O-methyltransferase Ste14